MRSLKLYEQLPRAIVQDTEGLDTDHNCTRCKLGEQPKLRTRCVAPEGEPGGLLIVGESPGKDEDMAGRPFIGISGKYLRSALAKHWSGPVAISNSLGCSPGADIDKSKLEKPVEACRPYLAQTIREVAPKRIVAVGAWAAFSIFGRSVPMFTMRRSYAYLYGLFLPGEEWYALGPTKPTAIPVMFVLHPAAALRNRFVKSWFDKDIEWALTATPPEPPINAIAHLVDNEQDALEAVRELEKAPRTSFDIEAAGIMFDPSYRVLCCSCSPLAADRSPTDTVFTWTKEGLDDLKARAVLAKWLNSAKHVKIGHNLKYDSNGVRSGLGIILRGIGADTRLARKLLEPESDGSLDKCSELVGMGGFKEESITANHDALAPLKQSLGAERRVAKYDAWAANPIGKAPPKPSKATRSATQYIQDLAYRDPLLVDVIRADPSESGRYMFALLPDDILYRRNALDTIATARLDYLLTGELKKEPQLQRTWNRIVMPASRAVEHVERWGVAVSKASIEMFDAHLEMQQLPVRARLDAYGKEFNPDSPQQVADLLFNKLSLPSVKQTGSEGESTDASVLEILRDKHPVAADIDDWRKLSKLRGTYAQGMLRFIRPDGRIHTNILLDGARSGRPSSINPNLFNAPRAESIEGKMFRDCFEAAEGKVLLEADYSQIELRVAAMLSNDPEMIGIYRSGVDFHTRTAQLIAKAAWGIDPSAVESKHRSIAKQINFGLCLAEGSLVLTDKGRVPIERVQLHHLVWDGVDWVSHDGVIAMGCKEVMNYGGLTATYDHEVFAEDERTVSFLQASKYEMYGRGTVSHIGSAYVYDLLNAGPRHRYTVSGRLVSNCYGMGDKELARRCKVTVTQAATIRAAILGKFKVFAKWIDSQIAFARKHGFVWTSWDGSFARRRPLYTIADNDDAKRVHAEHSAINSPVQGGASDYDLRSLTDLVEWICDDGMEQEVKLVLAVYDSLMFELPPNMVDEVAWNVKRTMLSHNTLGVPFDVDLKVGKKWGSMEPYKLPA